MTSRFVASPPVGAPLAMSRLGAGARSLRAPATTSMTALPCTGSKTPGWLTGPTTARGRLHVEPPLSDVDRNSNACLPPETFVPTPKTYARPRLSVRIVHPSIGLRWLLLAAEVIGCCVHVSPPSCDAA